MTKQNAVALARETGVTRKPPQQPGFDLGDAVQIYVLPGGRMPKRQTEGAIGFDVCLRALVSAFDMDARNPALRKTLFNFRGTHKDPTKRVQVERRDDELVYMLQPGESVLGGIGFITQMEFPLFYWVAPRSGLASKYGITVTNAPGTVDPDYRGEAGVVIENRSQVAFPLQHEMRVAQIVFQRALIPEFFEVIRARALSATQRGAGGFGSTGIR